MKFDDFNWEDIIIEAPTEEVADDEELTASDYTADEDLNIEEGSPEDEEDLGPENYNENSEEGEDELNLDEEEPLGDENLDDETPEDEQIDNGEEEVVDDMSSQQNKYLIQDFIELFNRIEEILAVFRSNDKLSLRMNPAIIKIKQNLDKLYDVTYDYITDKFAKNSYVANLYQFNLIIQALNINVQMLEEVNNLSKTLKEKAKKNGGNKVKSTSNKKQS